MPDKPIVIAIVGPTASGKTAVSLGVAEALGGEIVACDSRTVYRYMDIGTAKPTAAETARAPHHLLDVVDPDQRFTVAQYRDLAGQAIAGILGRGRLPVVVGGTGFYARALLEDLSIPQVEPQQDLRAELRALAESEGRQALHDRLRALDPEAAARIAANDIFRVIRALEVTMVGGRPFSELACRAESPYRTVWIGLTANDRAHLHRRIADRFARQLEDGLLAEVRELVRRFGRCPTIANTVNYKELIDCLEGEAPPDMAIEECIKHNRQLARRQLIWFRANRSIRWFAIDELDGRQLLSSVLQAIETNMHGKDVG